MARKEHFGDLFSFKNFGSGIDRPSQYPLRKGIGFAGFLVAESPVQESHYGIRHEHGRQFASAHDKITDRNFQVDLGLADAVVDSLVVPADQHQVTFLGKFLG